MNEIRDAALNFEAIYSFQKKSKDGVVIHLVLHPEDVPTELLTAWIGSRFMVAMVQLSDVDEPVPLKSKTEGDKAVAAAGTLCRNQTFQRWISYESVMDISTEDEAAQWLKEYLGIESRSVLRTDEGVREEFFHLREKFIQDFKAGKIK